MKTLRDLEARLGRPLPPSLLAFYDAGNEFAPVARIIDNWSRLKRAHDAGDFARATVAAVRGVRPVWWSPLWIPITDDGAGNYHCVDLDPGDGGTYGQIILFWHDNDERSIVAPSIDEWVEGVS